MATVTINIPSQLPALTGNSLLYLRVNLAENGIEWAATAGGGITINSTAIASGTVNRVLFQGAGNVVQQDAGFVWQNVDKRLILGADQASVDTNPRLVVVGKNPSGTTVLAAFHNSTGNSNTLIIRDDNRVLVNSSTLAFSGSNNTRLQIGTNDATVNSVDIVSSATNGGQATFLRLRNDGTTKFIQFDNGSGTINCFFQHTNAILNRIDLVNQSATEQLFVVRDINSTGGVTLAGGNTAARVTLARSGVISIGLYDNNFNDSFWNPTGVRTFIFGGTTRTNASALVEMVSTNRGFLPPRMTTTERNAISTPATGLTLYNTTTNTLDIRSSASVWNKFGSETVIIGNGTTSSTFGLQVHNSTGTNNALIVRDDTRVGIGTDAPATRFHVVGASDERIRLDNGANNLQLFATSGNNTGLIFGSGLFFRQNGATAQILELVGAGTNPLTRLDIRGGTVGNILLSMSAGGANNTSILELYRGTTVGIRLVDNNSNDSYHNTTRSFVFGGTARSSASALVEMISSSQGFLPPRNANPAANITSPAEGLIAFNTTNKKLQVYDGTNWIDLH